MNHFTRLYTRLDESNRTTDKVAAMADYFAAASPADAAWAIYFLTGRRPKRLIPVRRLADWAAHLAGIADWLFAECYDAVGDLAETIALLLPDTSQSTDRPFHEWVEQRLLPLAAMDEPAQREMVTASWRELDAAQRFIWNKLVTGEFRVGVSQQLVIRALTARSGIDPGTIAHRLTGRWHPTPEFYASLISPDAGDAHVSRPYPFFLAHPLDSDPASLGDVRDWQAEWKWDGIRAQFIRRAGRTFIWSRGEELVTHQFPELDEVGPLLPDGTVLDGEILPFEGDRVLPYAALQRRLGRKVVSPRIRAQVPLILMTYDLLEEAGADIRELPLSQRRARLERLLADTPSFERLRPSPLVEAASWDELAALRARSRELGVEGLMLKLRSSPYRVGRTRGDWWKWKIGPLTIDAVLIYAQPGSGRRASLFTDYTFAVWDDGNLVPFAKAYSGLTDAEIREVDAWVRRNTTERFGPVRHVRPELVFELAFEAIQPSTRHKSGLAVRFPRIHRWRKDKKPAEADTLTALRALLPAATPNPQPKQLDLIDLNDKDH